MSSIPGQRTKILHAAWHGLHTHTHTHIHTHTHTFIHTHTQNSNSYYFKLLNSRSVVPDSLWPQGLQLTRLLCPWDFPGNDTGVGCHFLLQGIFPTQGSNPGLLHCRQILYRVSYKGSPYICVRIQYLSFSFWLTTALSWSRILFINVGGKIKVANHY